MKQNKKVPLRLRGEIKKTTRYKYSRIVNSLEWEEIKKTLNTIKENTNKAVLESNFYNIEWLTKLNKNIAYITAIDDLIKIVEEEIIINDKKQNEDT